MKNKQTFTLLELLVVIAIIGVLVSMLTPGLSRARELARSVKCAGNLKQIALGFNIYSLDFDDYFPSPSFEDDDGNFMSWHDMLSNYAMSSSINVFVCPSVDEDAKFNPYGRGFPGTTQIQEATYTINSMDDQTADWRVDGVNLLDGTPYSPT